jgi:hypothetical protein
LNVGFLSKFVDNQPKSIHEHGGFSDAGYSSSNKFIIDDIIHLFDVQMPGPVIMVGGKTFAPQSMLTLKIDNGCVGASIAGFTYFLRR